jgi:hypothetical protein
LDTFISFLASGDPTGDCENLEGAETEILLDRGVEGLEPFGLCGGLSSVFFSAPYKMLAKWEDSIGDLIVL